MDSIAHPPATLEGWYALHQVFSLPADARDPAARRDLEREFARELAIDDDGGWSVLAWLVGSRADAMAVQMRPTLDALGEAQRRASGCTALGRAALAYSFLSVTEAGLYHVSAQLAKEARERGGSPGDEAYEAALAERVRAERELPQIRRRIFPPVPRDMPYVCFYPMSKKRAVGENWYTLTLEERSRLMYAHGLIGRRYAGRVQQIITGAIGLDAWEWGVTLFAKDPLDFKRVVTDMRFDPVSAHYAEFGEFFVGRAADTARGR